MNKFYKTEHLTFDEKKQILNEARKKCFIWWVDKLDCGVSWSRKKIEMSFEDIMKKFNEKSYLVITLRDRIIEGMYIEICFKTYESPNYFLWVRMTIENEVFFINKYNLKEYE